MTRATNPDSLINFESERMAHQQFGPLQPHPALHSAQSGIIALKMVKKKSVGFALPQPTPESTPTRSRRDAALDQVRESAARLDPALFPLAHAGSPVPAPFAIAAASSSRPVNFYESGPQVAESPNPLHPASFYENTPALLRPQPINPLHPASFYEDTPPTRTPRQQAPPALGRNEYPPLVFTKRALPAQSSATSTPSRSRFSTPQSSAPQSPARFVIQRPESPTDQGTLVPRQESEDEVVGDTGISLNSVNDFLRRFMRIKNAEGPNPTLLFNGKVHQDSITLLTEVTLQWHSAIHLGQGLESIQGSKEKGENVGKAIFLQAMGTGFSYLLKPIMEYFDDMLQRTETELEKVRRVPKEMAEFQEWGFPSWIGVQIMDKTFFAAVKETIILLARERLGLNEEEEDESESFSGLTPLQIAMKAREDRDEVDTLPTASASNDTPWLEQDGVNVNPDTFMGFRSTAQRATLPKAANMFKDGTGMDIMNIFMGHQGYPSFPGGDKHAEMEWMLRQDDRGD